MSIVQRRIMLKLFAILWVVLSIQPLYALTPRALITPSVEPTPIPQERIFFEADARFSEAPVQEAMRPLEQRGIKVVTFIVQSGGEADLTERLNALGLSDGTKTSENVIALYIAIEERYSEVRWNTVTYDNVIDGLNVRRTFMNPSLRDGLYTEALVRSLEALESAFIQADTGTPTPRPKTTNNQSNYNPFSGIFFSEILKSLFVGALIYLLYRKFPLLFDTKSPPGTLDNDSRNRMNTFVSSSDNYSSFSDSSSSSDSGGSDGGSWND